MFVADERHPSAEAGPGCRHGPALTSGNLVGQSATFLAMHYSAMSQNATAVEFRTWMCVVCGYMYEEAKGVPEEGIAAGTRWEDVPETWTCPDCGVTKDDFEMIEV